MSLPNENSSEEKGYFGNAAFTPKPRKPYIITKRKKRWTEEEHAKFLEAVRLHGRAWRMIEEHIGTKTTVQIRSHAQKYFSKVTRESINEVDIPPPRPKRKPTHPYPRNQINPGGRETQISRQSKDSSPLPSLPTLAVSEEEDDDSPTSVLSPLRSGNTDAFFSRASAAGRKRERENRIGGEDDENISAGLKSDEKMTESISGKKQKSDFKAEDSEGPARSMKLFGQTVFVTDSRKQAPENANFISNSAGNRPQNSAPAIENGIDGDSTMCLLAAGVLPLLYYFKPYAGTNNSAVAAGMIPVVPQWLYRNMPFTVVSEDLPRFNAQSECSGAGSNPAPGGGEEMKEKLAAIDKPAPGNKPATGFIPYRKT